MRRLTRRRRTPIRARVKKLLDNSVVCCRAPELPTTFAHSLALNNISRDLDVIIQHAFGGVKGMLKTGQFNCFKTGHL